MAILIDETTRVVVQGITGSAGSYHSRQMIEYGTKIVAGVTPGRGGERFEEKVPVFHTVAQAVLETGAQASVVFVPPAAAADSILEAVAAGIRLVVVITEGIPTMDMIRVRRQIEASSTTMIGPNCPGIISPGKSKMGIMPGAIHRPGKVGVVSRSGTLTYEAVGQLTALGIGQSSCIGIGGDPIGGLDFVDVLGLFNADPQTEAVVLIGEIGGVAEERAAAYIERTMKKPVAAFIAGRTAPPGKRMGHAGAIISGGSGKAEDKIAAFEKAGVRVAPTPAAIGETLKSLLR